MTKEAVHLLYRRLEPVIPRPNPRGRGRPRRLNRETSLVLTLYWLHSTTVTRDLALIFGCPPNTVLRYIHFWLRHLSVQLPNIPEAAVMWPSPSRIHFYASLIDKNYPNIGDDFGGKFSFAFMDGCNFPIQNHGDLNLQNNYYNGAYAGAKVGNLFIWAPDGTIIYAKLNCPGTMADGQIASDAYARIEGDVPDGYAVLADTAFPSLGGKVLRPLKISEALTASPKSQTLSRIVSGMRVPCEWGNRGLQACFPRLRLPLPVNNELRSQIITTCVLLCNFRTRKMDYGQIRTYYHKDYIRVSGPRDLKPNGLDRYLEAASRRRRRQMDEED